MMTNQVLKMIIICFGLFDYYCYDCHDYLEWLWCL